MQIYRGIYQGKWNWCFTIIIDCKLYESNWQQKEGSKTTITPKSLVLLYWLSFFVKKPVYYTETAIWKSRHRNLGINISIGITFVLQYVLWKNTQQYSYLYLVIQHQNPFATVLHFLRISYPVSTKIANKT